MQRHSELGSENGVERLGDLLLIGRGSLGGGDEEEMCLRWGESGV